MTKEAVYDAGKSNWRWKLLVLRLWIHSPRFMWRHRPQVSQREILVPPHHFGDPG